MQGISPNIYYCILAYPGGIDALAEEFRPHMSHGLVQEGLTKMAKHFSSLESIGPKFVADFEEAYDPEEAERDGVIPFWDPPSGGRKAQGHYIGIFLSDRRATLT